MHARRRSIRFSGTEVTIGAAVKDMNTFCYNSLDTGRVRKLVAEVKKAMDGT
jgi:hypothetical protein